MSIVRKRALCVFATLACMLALSWMPARAGVIYDVSVVATGGDFWGHSSWDFTGVDSNENGFLSLDEVASFSGVYLTTPDSFLHLYGPVIFLGVLNQLSFDLSRSVFVGYLGFENPELPFYSTWYPAPITEITYIHDYATVTVASRETERVPAPGALWLILLGLVGLRTIVERSGDGEPSIGFY